MKHPVVSGEFEDWEVLRRFLPDGWEEQAWLCGAMRRARYITSPEIVLRILMLHLANGCSLAETAARAQASGLGAISSVGVFKRLRAAGSWLRWLAQQERGAAVLPLGAVGRRVRAVDATTVCEPGSTGGDWRVHYAVNLADLQCDFFQLTEIRQSGETFRRVPVNKGDILLGDRVYAAPPGVAHVLGSAGDVIVRLNRQALPMFDSRHQRIDLAARMRRLPGHSPTEYPSWVKGPQGDWIAGRLVALRQSAEVTRWWRKRMLRRAQRDQQVVSPLSLELAEYFLLWTSLKELPAAEVLDLYRLRWQIERVFKRMKSILGLGHLPKKDPLSAQAWLQGKLFVGLLIERMVDAAAWFFPWGYPLATAAQPVAGN
jgi:Transposase DDE domain